MTSIALAVVIFFAMYFMIIRPQKKQQEEVKALRGNLQVGDKIVTIGGIVAEIIAFSGEEDLIVNSGGSEMIFKRKAVARRENPQLNEPEKDNEQENTDVNDKKEEAFEFFEDEE